MKKQLNTLMKLFVVKQFICSLNCSNFFILLQFKSSSVSVSEKRMNNLVKVSLSHEVSNAVHILLIAMISLIKLQYPHQILPLFQSLRAEALHERIIIVVCGDQTDEVFFVQFCEKQLQPACGSKVQKVGRLLGNSANFYAFEILL